MHGYHSLIKTGNEPGAASNHNASEIQLTDQLRIAASKPARQTRDAGENHSERELGDL